MAHSIDELRKVFTYNPETGEIFKTGGYRGFGQIATVKPGDRARLFVCIQRKRISAHRLAWALVKGYWPAFEIDHINGDEGDNRLINLRDVCKSINQQNKKAPRSDNKSGFLGVSWHPRARKWRAQITVNGKQRYIGLFDTPEVAHSAYINTKRNLHPGCTI